ncbi:myosin light chain 5-like [Oncorhynchus clarkii lewisi]|uniref:myosin light chain 5-like n=1 Tax=Oncorhynchus clarkii lewisi TaxID=490388 RepID=UPI0039B9057D
MDDTASRKTKKKELDAMRAQRASSNVFSMFKQTQIQEFKEVFTLTDQDRDGFIDKEDLKDTYESPGRYFNDTLFQLPNVCGHTFKLVGLDVSATPVSDRCIKSKHRAPVKQMFQSPTFDPAGNLDYKSLCYIITRGEEQEE